MKITRKLSSSVLDNAKRRAIATEVVRETALELADEIKITLQKGAANPKGRTYRRGAITKTPTKETKALNLKTLINAKGKEKAIVGYKFHRASRKGDPPATDTGGLIGSVAVADISDLKSRVSMGKNYADRLDDAQQLNRPFFRVNVEKIKPIFKQRLLERLKG